MEGSLNAGDNFSAVAGHSTQEEEIKRDLHSRHINMIAIAGMIVRAFFLVASCLTLNNRVLQYQVEDMRAIAQFELTEDVGNWTLPRIRQSPLNCRPSRRSFGIHLHGPNHFGCHIHNWRDHDFHAQNRWLCSPCYAFRGTSAGSRCRVELLYV